MICDGLRTKADVVQESLAKYRELFEIATREVVTLQQVSTKVTKPRFSWARLTCMCLPLLFSLYFLKSMEQYLGHPPDGQPRNNDRNGRGDDPARGAERRKNKPSKTLDRSTTYQSYGQTWDW